jgi:hypothetical protein
MREAGLQLLDTLERLEALDRRFQVRSRMVNGHGNGTESPNGSGASFPAAPALLELAGFGVLGVAAFALFAVSAVQLESHMG